MKTKFNFKVLIALGIMLLAVLIFNTNIVNAVTNDEILTAIPNTLHIKSTSKEIVDPFIKNNWVLYGNEVETEEKLNLPEGYTYELCFTNANDMNAGVIFILRDKDNNNVGSKYVRNSL